MKIERYCYSLIQKVVEFIHRNDVGLKVLMFHQVNDDTEKWIDSGVCITQKSFETLIDRLVNMNYEFISSSQVGNSNFKDKIVVTFDDVFKDAFQNAFPYLIKRRIPFTVFVSEALVDSELYISSEDIVFLRECDLCTIGYHANHHTFLRDKSENALLIETDTTAFEKKYGLKIEYFAYPYGSIYAVGKKAIRTVEKAGYKAAFSTLSYDLTQEMYYRNKYFLPRINICESNIRKLLENKDEID